jgi:hypothetical protein
MLTITKEGFEPIEKHIAITDSRPLEFKLRPVAPGESLSLPSEERIKKYQQDAEDRFAKGRLAIPYEDSAFFYTTLILSEDPTNQFALDLNERIRKALHQAAQWAASRGDLGQAQEVYSFLVDYYPHDQDARMSQMRLETQLSSRRGEVRDLVRKAEESLRAGELVEPPRASAYFYSRQALAIDRLNEKAQAIHDEINQRLTADADQAAERGDFETAIKKQERIVQLFSDDKRARERLREMNAARQAEAKNNDAASRRVRGLASYVEEGFAAAIPDLEFAVFEGHGTPEVIFALGRSLLKTGQLERAEHYFKLVPPSDDDVYRSAIAALGDVAMQRGDSSGAAERYKEARRLGGSTLYPLAKLDERIERIENKQREREAAPSPVSIRVRHEHGGLLGGSCSGPLTVDATGLRYDGSEHVFASNLMGVAIRITRDEMILQLQKSSQKFKAARADAERFREALARYQQAYPATSK